MNLALASRVETYTFIKWKSIPASDNKRKQRKPKNLFLKIFKNSFLKCFKFLRIYF